jgi:hypothetical protein
MKIIFTILIIFCASNAFAQTPNDTMIKSLKNQFNLTEYDSPKEVIQFNKDTILIAGYLSETSEIGAKKNVVFKTTNGGKKWRVIKFNGDAYIYDTHLQDDGKIWMGGSDEVVHYSNDYGETWTTKPKPLKPIVRVLSIFMTDSLNGVAGGLQNGLALTEDNWQSALQIPSPLDQNKYSITENSARKRVNKVQILDSVILINQNDHIYFSKLNPIEWKKFNVPAIDFQLNKDTIILFSIRDKVYHLDSRLNLLLENKHSEKSFFSPPVRNENADISTFFKSKINSLNIKTIDFDYDKMSGGCIRYPIFKENINYYPIENSAYISTLKSLIQTRFKGQFPKMESLSFNYEDITSYRNLYRLKKVAKQEEKVWGGDFTNQLDIENKLFRKPNKTIDSLNQEQIDNVFRMHSVLWPMTDTTPYIEILLVNNQSDTLTITNKYAVLSSLPWTIEYKGQKIVTYDSRFTEYLKPKIPRDNKTHKYLYSGDLIYQLVREKIIKELKYSNGY